MNTTPILTVKNLSIAIRSSSSRQKRYRSKNEPVTQLTEDISFQIHAGELFALIGESGCGKTITAQAILNILPQPNGYISRGEVLFQGEDILQLDSQKIRKIRGKEIAMIFQEASSALNPLITIGKQLEEVFLLHNFTDKDKAQKRINELMKKMGLRDPDRLLLSYPHQLSGGMLQRIMIVMALLLRPKLIIADEPSTALDVTIQAQIMNLLLDICKENKTAILFITHNIGLIAQYTNRLSVMYAGRIVEEGPVADFIVKPLHPYSQGLIQAFPNLKEKKEILPIQGQVPSPTMYESGCRFRKRCSSAMPECIGLPALKTINDTQKIACFLYK